MKSSNMAARMLAGLLFLPMLAFAGGTVKGRVVFDGKVPEREVLEVSAIQLSQCKMDADAKHLDNSLIVSKEGGIKNFVITLSQKGGEVKPLDKAAHDQVKCRMALPVMVIPVGTTVEFKNSDSTIHNVSMTAFKNASFNKAVMGNSAITHTFDKAETNVIVRCSFHPWMKGSISVVDTNYYALTDENGNFEITDIPAGEYKFKAWHPVMRSAKTQDMNLDSETVHIQDGKTIDVQIKKAMN
ncbi:MAG: carboxypeptidase regulatory-like domain-containing protein [Planctomycetota bacterium]|nr:carboxypeptidase regulatory-like domain-containing protein [Planctomycetota bacterium]